METYKQMHEEAKKAKALKSLTPSYHDWKKDGDFIVGAFVSFAEVEGTLGNKSYNQYIFDTDKGLTKFSLGSAADNEVAAIFTPGMVYAIEYGGKEEIRGGKQINKFNISELEAYDLLPKSTPKPKKDGPAVDPKQD